MTTMPETPTRLDVLPEKVAAHVEEYHDQIFGATEGRIGEPVGFFADTTTRPGVLYWVIVGTTGMLWFDPELELMMRVKSIHPLPTKEA